MFINTLSIYLLHSIHIDSISPTSPKDKSFIVPFHFRQYGQGDHQKWHFTKRIKKDEFTIVRLTPPLQLTSNPRMGFSFQVEIP